ncbi:chaperonin 10-like protein [Cladochytrium replicatum]|nr:chaperonin 10-like protein [Cladochytrium replicatum]
MTENTTHLPTSDTFFHGMAAYEPGVDVKPWTYPARAFGEEDIEIKISHCGICGSDIHTITGGWGTIKYPQVVGHEIVGHITRIGSKVDSKKYAVGTRVGVGAQCGSCGDCSECSDHAENLCTKGWVGTYNGKLKDGYITQGGYSDFFRCNNKFVVPIPEQISSETAAPLMCAGITTYAPLRRYNAGPGKKVGVVGIGGLGHLGLQWSHALGAETTAISSSARKAEAAKKLGAEKYLNSSDPEDLKRFNKYFDIILCTSFGVDTDWNALLNLLAVRGTFILVALPEEPLKIKPGMIINGHRSITGSIIGSPSEIEEMLAFAVEKGVRPVVEVVPMAKAAEGVSKLHKGKAHFRVVLEN